ncbi:hypothetical protein MLD38_008136 [Melastoma candidum]|uniref:Uncharacterized protein n=1 Tax=Melastoma candidum TaxID=119954 RepID=A0ACB9RT23_9MYRT|nr:hypothetical protein MLD38_008136 [Melastoma candidum]
MEVTVITKEEIRPSSPTPDHLKIYKHSLLDQLIPPTTPFTPIILFYVGGLDAECLKRSLSYTLPRFYPLAGRAKDDLSIDCDDRGVLFTTARVNQSLSQFLSRPDLASLQYLLPRDLPTATLAGTRISHVQVNSFECGGVALAVCVAHRLLDGASVGIFLKAWAATSRGEEPAVIPDFSAPSMFPASDDMWLKDSAAAVGGLFIRTGKAITKRFQFNSSAIVALKDLARSSDIESPSRVEAVSAFIWKHAWAASRKQNSGEEKLATILAHSVNLRKRLTPPMPGNSLGNILWASYALYESDDSSEQSLPNMAAEVRKSIQKLGGHFLESLTGDKVKAALSQSHREAREIVSKSDAAARFACTSWCGFGYYDTDFGQGKPVWMSTVAGSNGAEVFLSGAILYDTRDGDGVEAWIVMDEKEMELLEGEEGMREFAVSNPSPLRSTGTPP